MAANLDESPDVYSAAMMDMSSAVTLDEGSAARLDEKLEKKKAEH